MKIIRIGKAADNDVVLHEKVAEMYHAELILDRDGTIEIKDLDSKYGTFLNHQKINHSFVYPGDQVQIGFQKFDYNELAALFESESKSQIQKNPLISEGSTDTHQQLWIHNAEHLNAEAPQQNIENLIESELNHEGFTNLGRLEEIHINQINFTVAELMDAIQDPLKEISHLSDESSKNYQFRQPKLDSSFSLLNKNVSIYQRKTIWFILIIASIVAALCFWFGAELAKKNTKKTTLEIRKLNFRKNFVLHH